MVNYPSFSKPNPATFVVIVSAFGELVICRNPIHDLGALLKTASAGSSARVSLDSSSRKGNSWKKPDGAHRQSTHSSKLYGALWRSSCSRSCCRMRGQLNADPHSHPNPVVLGDADYLNFALNLEYLEAEFYTLATAGTTIENEGSGIGPGTTKYGGGSVVTKPGGPGACLVPWTIPAIQAYATETATEERHHVNFLRANLGPASVAQPNLDLYNSFNALAMRLGSRAPSILSRMTSTSLLGRTSSKMSASLHTVERLRSSPRQPTWGRQRASWRLRLTTPAWCVLPSLSPTRMVKLDFRATPRRFPQPAWLSMAARPRMISGLASRLLRFSRPARRTVLEPSSMQKPTHPTTPKPTAAPQRRCSKSLPAAPTFPHQAPSTWESSFPTA
jgi:Ferritin-like domain